MERFSEISLYALPICIAVLILANMASIAPPLRKNRGGKRLLTGAGWIIYLFLNFAAFWWFAYAILYGPREMREETFWVMGVFGAIAAVRVGAEIGALISIASRFDESLERTLWLEQQIERTERAIQNEEARRREADGALHAEAMQIRSKTADVPDDVDSAPNPALLLSDSGAQVAEGSKPAASKTPNPPDAPEASDAPESDPSLLLKDAPPESPPEPPGR